MSKQSEAKEKQGYSPKSVPHVCMNCAHFKMDVVDKPSFGGMVYKHETNLHCEIGGFAVKKMATCNEFLMIGCN